MYQRKRECRRSTTILAPCSSRGPKLVLHVYTWLWLVSLQWSSCHTFEPSTPYQKTTHRDYEVELTSLFQLATASTSAVGQNDTREMDSPGGSTTSMSLTSGGAAAGLAAPKNDI